MKPDSKNNTPPEPSPKELSEALYLNRLILESEGEGIYGLDAEGMKGLSRFDQALCF